MTAPDGRLEQNAEGRRWRPDCALTIPEMRAARRLRRRFSWSVDKIAAHMGHRPYDIALSLSAMRAERDEKANHKALNVTRDTADVVLGYARDRRIAVWQAVDEILRLAGLAGAAQADVKGGELHGEGQG